jgi:DNA-binding XRE family transcriptional regulator
MTGEQFKAAREAMGLSVSQLASKLDLNRSTIFRIEQTGCTRVMALAMERLVDCWRGIESAPKDGSILLLYCPTGIERLYVSPAEASCYCIGFHGDNGGMLGMADNWQSVESREEICGYGSEYTGAMTETATVACNPTHWKPFPKYQ